MRLVSAVAVLLLTGGAAEEDPFSGRYRIESGFGTGERVVELVRDLNGYRFASGLYRDYRFVPDGTGVLRDRERILGEIRRVEDRDGCRVLRVSFCYNHFRLIEER